MNEESKGISGKERKCGRAWCARRTKKSSPRRGHVCFMRLVGNSVVKIGDPRGPPIPGAATLVETGTPSPQVPPIRKNKGGGEGK